MMPSTARRISPDIIAGGAVVFFALASGVEDLEEVLGAAFSVEQLRGALVVAEEALGHELSEVHIILIIAREYHSVFGNRRYTILRCPTRTINTSKMSSLT